MSLTLDPATEQRIHREAQLRNLTEPGQLINRALDLLIATEEQEAWLQGNRPALNQRLEESYAQAQRGEIYTSEQARTLLAQDREERAKRAVA